MLLFGVLVENNEVVIGAFARASRRGSVVRGLFFFGGEARSSADRNRGKKIDRDRRTEAAGEVEEERRIDR